MLFKRKTTHHISDSLFHQFDELEYIETITDLSLCYTILASQEKEYIQKCGTYIYEYLKDKDIFEIIKIAESFKQHTSLEWYIDWKSINISHFKEYFSNKDKYISLLIIGSFHPNGYYREKCLDELLCYQNTLAYILCRLNDWVSIIKDKSYTYTLNYIETCSMEELLKSYYVLDKLQRSQRRNHSHFEIIKEDIYNIIVNRKDDEFITLLLSLSQIYRQCFYKYILPLQLFSLTELNLLISKDKNHFCMTLLIRILLEKYPLSEDDLQIYLSHKNSFIRKEALQHKYLLIQDIWNQLESFLLDPSYSIRDYTRFIYRKHHLINFVEFYKKSLDNPIAIMGIGECGKEKDAEVIIPFLNSNYSKTVKFTLYSLGKLLKYKGKDIYWKYLFNDEITIFKAVYLCIKDNHIIYGAKCIYEHYLHEDNLYRKSYLFKLLLNEHPWDRLPYLLMLYDESDDKTVILNAIKNRNLYYQLSQEEGQCILDILNQKNSQLPQNMKDLILFDLKYVMK